MFEHNAHIAAEISAEQEVVEADGSVAENRQMLPCNAGYQFPAAVWGGMFAFYGIFFVAIFAATGGSGYARFAIVVSALYTVMYFGVARIIARQGGRRDISPLDQGQPLQTWTGPMSSKAVYSQVLIVPLVLAIFGIGMAIIIGLVA